MKNKAITFGVGNMAWTIVFREHSGRIGARTVQGPNDKHAAWRLIEKEYPRLIAMVPGRHPVCINKEAV